MTEAGHATTAATGTEHTAQAPPGVLHSRPPVGGAADKGGVGGNGGGGAPPTKPQAPWGALVVIAGIVAIVVVSMTAILHYKASSDVATATVGVSGVIAALVGAYFGVRGSSLAQANTPNSPDGGVT